MSIYYLGFQRAPPKIAHAGDCIRISPIILNDLREEVYCPQTDDEIRINVAWVADEDRNERIKDVAATIPWDGPATSYKHIALSVPCQEGSYRLAIWAEAGNSSSKKPFPIEEQFRHIVNIQALALHISQRVSFLPALSDVVAVRRLIYNGTNHSKSSTIARLFQTRIGGNLLINEETGFELDKHLWDASILMTSYIEEQHRKGRNIFSARQKSRDEQLRIIELGAGTGLVSIGLAGILASDSSDLQVRITATDLEPALELLQRNIDENRALWEGKAISVDCQSLDWSEETTIADADLILVSDCTYNPTYFKPLCTAIKNLLRQGRPSCHCLLAKKHRHVDEEALWPEMAAAGLASTLLAGTQAVQVGAWGIWSITL